MKLNSKTVKDTFIHCLYEEGEDTTNHIKVNGVVLHIGFNPIKIEEEKKKIIRLLDELPDNFKEGSGGGWSFINASTDKDGNLWGEHQSIDELLCLGIAIGKVEFLMPREVWSSLPGGMPYFVIKK